MAKKETATVPEGLSDIQMLEQKIASMRKAQKIFAAYTQEQVGKIFFEAAMAANKIRIPLAKMACEETGMGVMEGKVIKNHYAAEYMYNSYKKAKTCGVIEEDTSYGIKKIAEPVGLVGAVIPTTNPTSTAIFKCLICLKTRNAILISPHPRAQQCTNAAAKVVLDAAVKAGAPEDIIGWIDEPTIDLSNQLMKSADVILATGGPGMVKAAYSSGKPAIGVGPGNTPVIMDSSCDIPNAVYSVIHSKTFDNGMVCASEQSGTALADIYDAVRAEFVRRGCHILNQEDSVIAKLAGFEVPEKTRILIGGVTSVDVSEPFAHEKLSPVLALYKAPEFDTALDMAEKLVADTGTKWLIADYELLPNMAIIDTDYMMNQPKGLTSASGIDALTHALEAYASIMATDYTDGLALMATKNIFQYLPRAYEKGAADPVAREKMPNASTMAGMSFANAFLGICHSMAHKLGAYHHLPHGVANALLIELVMRYF